MTIFKGLLLFDIAEEPIGEWKNQLGYRGLIEVWKIPRTQDFICIEYDEDSDCEEVWLGNDKTGDCENIGFFDTVEEADKGAKEFMRENPHGWK